MICERTGEKTKNGKASGKISFQSTEFAIGKTRYLVTADPKHQGYQPGERVALVAAYNALPFLPGDNPGFFAENFIKEMYDWTLSMRTEKSAPKDLAVDRVISFHPDDNLSAEKALLIAQEAVEEVMGPLDSRVSLFSVHTDTKHTHVHFEASVVNNKGQIFNKRADDLLWNKAMDRLEKKYNLTRVIDRGYEPVTSNPKKPEKKKPSKGALQRKKRTGEPTLIEQHQAVLDRALERSNGCFLTFIETLIAEDVWLVANIRNTKAKVRGVGFRYKGEYFSGSDLGRKYTWKQLSEHLNYDAETHNALLLEIKERYESVETKSCEIDAKPASSYEATNIRLPSGTPRNSALYRVFKNKKVSNGDIVYRWKSVEREAFRETTTETGVCKLVTNSGLNRTVIKAMLQRMKELDRTEVSCNGSSQFMKIVAEVGKNMGITVFGPDNKPIIKVENIKVEEKDVPEPISESEPTPIPEPKPEEPESAWEQLTVIEQKRVHELMKIMHLSHEKALDKFLKAKQRVLNRSEEYNNDESEELNI